MPEKIPPFDYRIELQCIRTEIDEAIARVLDSGNLILGPEVEAFEQDFARLCEIEFAVGVASGTDALILALKVLNIGHNDNVITVANTAVPTVSAIRAVGAIPRFVDIDPRTLQMCPRALSLAIGSDVRCIIPVHLHGHPADIISIRKIAEECNIPVIADCAQAHGATVNRISVGQLGDICCFSFYPTKNLGAFGDGGMCVTSSLDLAERLRECRQYGFRAGRISYSDGICSRLDELQAAILNVRIRRFAETQKQRADLAAQYTERLKRCPIQLPIQKPDCVHAWHQYVIRTQQRRGLCRHLDRGGIGYGIHYPVPIHKMPAYLRFAPEPGLLAETEKAADEILSLPLFPGMTSVQVERVSSTIIEFFESGPEPE